jgi:hypothetical protein
MMDKSYSTEFSRKSIIDFRDPGPVRAQPRIIRAHLPTLILYFKEYSTNTLATGKKFSA